MAETQEAQAQEETQPDQTQPEVNQAQLSEVGPGTVGGDEENLDVLLDIQLPITVTMGKTQIPFRRLLQLRPGSVLNLEKRIGQPAEITVQDVTFATGDIVVVDDCYAVRIREIINSEAGSEIADSKAKT